MKRALITFGNPFGLALYDGEQTGVRHTRRIRAKLVTWQVFDESGNLVDEHENPVAFCMAMRSAIDGAPTAVQLMDLWRWNRDAIGKLRQRMPELKTDRARHYGEILSALYTQRLTEFAANGKAPATSRDDHDHGESSAAPDRPIGGNGSTGDNGSEDGAGYQSGVADPSGANVGPGLDGDNGDTNDSVDTDSHHTNRREDRVRPTARSNSTPPPPIVKPQRVRDPEHLRAVAKLPCLICDRTPSHAHHVRHAEPRALSRKVSDRWVVPLCATHHRQLHDHGSEESWWEKCNIDPLKVAAQL